MSSEAKKKRVLDELQKRLAADRGLIGSLFPQQRAAAEDRSKRKLYNTTRRSGKTYGYLVECLDDGRRNANCRYVYIAKTRPSAEDIAWPLLKEINNRHGLGIHFQEAKLQASLPNGSMIKLYGADQPGWMSRLYGQRLKKVGIDEAAFFAVPLAPLIEDILEPSLSDQEGELILMSIPGFVRAGYFWDAYCGKSKGWSVHEWGALDNPYMARQFKTQIDRLIDDNPEIIHTPSFQRNYLGKWVYDTADLIYPFDAERNTVDSPPWDYRQCNNILGVDFGWFDSTSFSLCSWHPNSPDFVELESFKKPKMQLEESADRIRSYLDAYGGNLTIVADPARRQLIEEMRSRFDVPIHAADKTDKQDWIELINSDLILGKIKILSPEMSPHVEEMSQLKWKVYPNGKRVEERHGSNDCCDAFLYAYRHSYHSRFRKETPSPSVGTIDYWRNYERDLEERLVAELDAAQIDWDRL